MSARRGMELAAIAAAAAAGYMIVAHLIARSGRQAGGSRSVDLIALQGRVLDRVGHTRIDVVDLGDGIVELVGEASDWDQAHGLVDLVKDSEGVDTVLNRLWVRTPKLVS